MKIFLLNIKMIEYIGFQHDKFNKSVRFLNNVVKFYMYLKKKWRTHKKRKSFQVE